MFCRDVLKFFLAAVISISADLSLAEEKAEQKAEAKPATEEKSAMQSEWFELQARLQVLKAKIRSKNENVKKLISEKQVTKDEKRAVAIVNDLKQEYADLQATIRDYEEQRAKLNYRFPEKGLTEGRTYQRVEVKTLDEMENEFSLEGKVKKALGLLRQQYPSEKPSAPERGLASEDSGLVAPVKKGQTDPSRSKIIESQILSK